MSMLFVQVERVEELRGRADDYFRCDLCSDDAAKRKPMTNADRSRSLTDEEQAETFAAGGRA